MIVDAHLHCTGREDADGVLRALDEAHVDVGVLLAPFLTAPYALDDRDSLRRANAHLAALVRAAPDRLKGLAVVNPLHAQAPADAREALDGLALTGLKLVPSGWYPDDERAHAVYRVADEYGAPILFHSGVFIDGRSGRYCRPMGYEAVRDHPRVKVTLAHLSWPWTDEANAVGIIDLINGVPPDDAFFRFDLSFGAPPPYRHDVLAKALGCLTPALLQFGSDRFLPCDGAHIASAIDEVRTLLAGAGASAEDAERIFSGTARAWLAGRP
jgi:predicted TIM-barrel fold metal-dependent hydrolase